MQIYSYIPYFYLHNYFSYAPALFWRQLCPFWNVGCMLPGTLSVLVTVIVLAFSKVPEKVLSE